MEAPWTLNIHVILAYLMPYPGLFRTLISSLKRQRSPGASYSSQLSSTLLTHKLRARPCNTQLARLDDLGLENDLAAILPHLRP